MTSESGFHQSEDKRKLNCHKLYRCSYVTSILITKLTFAMFFFVTLVLSLLCGRSTGVFHYCFLSIRLYQTSISDIDRFMKAVVLWLAMNTSKEVNSSFSLLYSLSDVDIRH